MEARARLRLAAKRVLLNGPESRERPVDKQGPTEHQSLGNQAAVIWLALASLAFYSVSQWQFVLLLLASIAFNYLIGWLLMPEEGTGRSIAGEFTRSGQVHAR